MFYCEKCGFVKEIKIIERTDTLNICGEEITCPVSVEICLNCGGDVSGKNSIDEYLKHFRDEYKRRHSLLTSDEIKAIRTKLGLDQNEFAKQLGLCPSRIKRLELGLIQEVWEDKLIRKLYH